MNNREIVRQWAQMSNIWFWTVPPLLFISYLVFRDPPEGQVRYLFIMVGLLSCILFDRARCLAKEIVRLQEKIEELERRIP